MHTPDPEELYTIITSRFTTAIREITVGASVFRLIMVKDSNHLIDAVDPVAFALDERMPYWAELWPSSIALARYCLNDPGMRGRSVLELGCGLGLAGIAAARAGATVTMTDYDQNALLFATYNVLTNLPEGSFGTTVTLTEMDWRAPAPSPGYDMIIGADIVYERKSFSPVADLLASQLRPDGMALLTDPDRDIGRTFLAQASTRFDVCTDLEPVAWDNREFTIARMTLRHPQSTR